MKALPATLIAAWLTALTTMAEVPSTQQSLDAVQRTAPRLQSALSARGLQLGAPIYIRIFKETRELELWVERGAQFELFKIYEICTYSGGLGPKLKRGDRKSPEGFYFVRPGQLNPASRFHLSFNLGYPNAYDRAHGRTGSALMVHGDCKSIGCYAMTNPRIEEIYTMADAALRNTQPFFRVHIFPFRMTDDNMQRHAGSRWAQFWQNLRQGYDHFEGTRRPPNVEVNNGRYTFAAS